MGRKALYQQSDGLLLEHGFVAYTPAADQFMRDVADDFALEPRAWRWDGAQHVAVAPAPAVDPASMDNAEKALKVLALVMRDYCNALKAGAYTNKSIADMKADFAAKWATLP